MSVKPFGPANTIRPFTPKLNVEDHGERIAHALESIAVAQASMDHNLEILIAEVRKLGRR